MPDSPDPDPFATSFPGPDERRAFQSALVDWFDREGRDYPWRRTSDPYAILVSELMLQQTRIKTVLDRDSFGRWMSRFPTFRALARAEETEVLALWQGLGYYERARNLQRAARAVCEEHGGSFPEHFEQILELPGVGHYTAGAVFSFAYDRRAPIVDGNVARVMARLLDCRERIDTTAVRRQIWAWAEQLTPESGVRSYNSAIMELGQRVCVRGEPACGACPVRRWCLAAERGTAAELPRKRGGAGVTRVEERVGIALREGEILLRPERGRRRRGLWKLPEVGEDPTEEFAELFRFDYAITRYRVRLSVHRVPGFRIDSILGPEDEWHSLEDPTTRLPPLGAPYRRAIDAFRDRRDDPWANG